MTVRAVKEKELPELDDEFAQTASEFDTIDELRADVCAAGWSAVKALEQGVQARDKVLETLLDAGRRAAAGARRSADEIDRPQGATWRSSSAAPTH